MRKTDLKDLLETIEAIREELHPKLDSAFVVAVVQAEEQNPDDDEVALQAIESALKKLLKAKGAA